MVVSSLYRRRVPRADGPTQHHQLLRLHGVKDHDAGPRTGTSFTLPHLLHLVTAFLLAICSGAVAQDRGQSSLGCIVSALKTAPPPLRDQVKKRPGAPCLHGPWANTEMIVHLLPHVGPRAPPAPSGQGGHRARGPRRARPPLDSQGQTRTRAFSSLLTASPHESVC